MTSFKKILSIGTSLLTLLVAGYLFSSTANAQATVNFGRINLETSKYVIEVPNQQANSSCTDGSLMVGFNLDNVGDNYANTGTLNCRTVTGATLGPITAYPLKYLIEVLDQPENSSCPDGSIMVGFNLDNMGDNYSNTGTLYCRALTGVSLQPVVKKANIVVVENWWSTVYGYPQDVQAVSSSCPHGSLLVGFALNNQGSNYNFYGDLYCRKIGPDFDYSLGATNIASLAPGGTGQSTITASLEEAPITLTATYYGYCNPDGCYSSSPYLRTHLPDEQPYNPNLTTYSFADELWYFANAVCGAGNWTSNPGSGGYFFQCTNPLTKALPVPELVNFTLTSIKNSSGVEVLGKTDGTGIQFVSPFVPAGVRPTATSLLTVRGDASVPAGTYTATVGASAGSAYSRSTTFTITVGGVVADGFSLSNDGPKTVVAGDSATETITAAMMGAFNQPINLEVTSVKNPSNTEVLGTTGGPQFSSTPFATNPVTTSALNSLLSFGTQNNTTLGKYVVTVTGTSGSSTAVTSFDVNIIRDVYNVRTNGNRGCTPTPSHIQVSWSAYPSASGYNIYRKAGAGNYGSPIVSNLNALTYKDTTVTPDVIYTYKIVAIVGGVEQTASVETSNTVQAPLSGSCGTVVTTPADIQMWLNRTGAGTQQLPEMRIREGEDAYVKWDYPNGGSFTDCTGYLDGNLLGNNNPSDTIDDLDDINLGKNSNGYHKLRSGLLPKGSHEFIMTCRKVGGGVVGGISPDGSTSLRILVSNSFITEE